MLARIVLPLLLLCAALVLPAAHAAAPIPPEAVAAVQAGQTIDLIVEFDASQIETAAKTMRKTGETGDTPALLAFRATKYRQLKDNVEATLATVSTETRLEYSHLPMRLKRFHSLAALNAWAAHSQVLALHLNRQLHTTLAHSLPLIEQPAVVAGGYSGVGTTVAVIDNGIDYTNAAFGNCTAPGTPSGCRVVQSVIVGSATGTTDNTHGTNVSAIVAGVATVSQIAMLNAFSGSSASESDVIAGINWAISNRSTYNIVAINMSLGDGSKNTAACTSSLTNSFVTPVANAVNAGISVVAAAGNDSYTNAIGSPACVNKVISVGAVYSANWGATSGGCSDATTAADKVACFSDSASFLTMLAPGAFITAGGITEAGTSQATPHVSGAIAVLRAAFPTESLNTTLSRLTTNGVAVTDARNGIIKPRLDLLASARPANDNFSGRTALSGTSGSSSTTNLFATLESAEPLMLSGAGGHTVWWKWTAPASGQVSLNTHGSAIDTTLAVYATGSSASTLTQLAVNDDDGNAGGVSGLLFQATSGTEYEIAVDGKGSTQGNITLNWSLNTSAAANLSLNISGAATGSVGTNASYTLTATNTGPQTATNVKMTMTLPGNASYVSASLPCSLSGNTLTCSIGTLASGASTPLTLTLVWNNYGTQTLTALISSDLADPVSSNNSASLIVTESVAGGSDVPTLPQWAAIFLGMLMMGWAVKGMESKIRKS